MTSPLATGKTACFDLIVYGAGPAGASAACWAASRNLRVALVDKKCFPRDKLCGGALTGRALKSHQRIFGTRRPSIPLVETGQVQFFAFGSDLGTVSDAPPIALCMRCDLDAALVSRALEAGAADFTGQAGHLDVDSMSVSTPSTRLTAPLIIAADGVNSPTARQLFGAAFDRGEIGFALEIEEETARDRAFRIDFGAVEWGYGWQFPKQGGTTVGVGGILAKNQNMKAAMAAYVDTLGLHRTAKVKGQYLPFGAFRPIPGKGRILLAGDAAGLVDPITGEGIGHAMESGALAAQACLDALSAQAPDTALRRYGHALRPIHRSLRHARRLRHIMFRPWLRPAFLHRFRNSQHLKAEYMRLLAGETEYGAIMRKVTMRLPSLVLRGLKEI